MDLAQNSAHLEPSGMLVVDTSGRFDWVEKAIQRFYPGLRLAFDRTLGRWVICRRDHDLVRLKVPDIGSLGYHHEVWTVLFDCRWTTWDSERKCHEHHYREPGQWIIEKLAWMDPEQFQYNNAAWFEKKTMELAIAREQRVEKRQEDAVEALVAEEKFSFNKLFSAVPSTYKVSA